MNRKMIGILIPLLLASNISASKFSNLRGAKAKTSGKDNLENVQLDRASLNEVEEKAEEILEHEEQTAKSNSIDSNRNLQVISQGAVFQTYFLPLPEDQLRSETFLVINDDASGSIQNTFSIAVGIEGTIIYYDHWEDGYDEIPGFGDTTLVFGDGDLSNGFLTPNDILDGGTTYLLQNGVPLEYSSNPTLPYLFDGRDRIQVDNPIAVTRASFPDNPGSLMAGAIEIFNTGEWGTMYEIPLGQNDGVSNTNGHETVAAYVQAREDNTEIRIDGILQTTLNTGESFAASGILLGQTIMATAPVQVDILAGDVDSQFELRWFALIPRDNWGVAYVSPVALFATIGNLVGGVNFGFYNPNNSPITVTFVGALISQSSFNIPANGIARRELRPPGTTGTIAANTINFNVNLGNSPYYSGIKFESTQPFYAYAEIDGESGGGGEIFDWGFPLVPTDQLSTQVLVGDGRGCTEPTAASCDESISPLWITCEEACDLRLFLNGINEAPFNVTLNVPPLSSTRFYDPSSPYDYSGAIVTATRPGTDEGVNIAAAWGQDPDRSVSGDGDALDLGTVIVPLPGPLQTNTSGVIRGTVFDLTNDVFLPNIQVTLLEFGTETVLLTTETDNVGQYQFSDIDPGDYTLVQRNLPLYLDFSDFDNITDTVPDLFDSDTTVDNQIDVTLQVGEIDDGNNFVDIMPFPSSSPSEAPSSSPSLTPSQTPSALPSNSPSESPSSEPSVSPSESPSTTPSASPSSQPSSIPSKSPSASPSSEPSSIPSKSPSSSPSITSSDSPSETPSRSPSASPSSDPSSMPSKSPSALPSSRPSNSPSEAPSMSPSSAPSSIPSQSPSASPSSRPSDSPSESPSGQPSSMPSSKPSTLPSSSPSSQPSQIPRGDITGSVSDSNGGNLDGVTIRLQDDSGVTIQTTLTDSSGSYSFLNLLPDNYTVVQTNLDGFIDVSDQDESVDGDIFDADTTVDNTINVTLNRGEEDTGNNFVDMQLGNITGSVMDTSGNDLDGVNINLIDESGNVADMTQTDSSGTYSFLFVVPGNYTITQENLPGFNNTSDQDEEDDGDISDSDTTVDNMINVTLNSGEIDAGNNFVDVQLGNITGNVMDTNGGNLNNVMIALRNDEDNIVATTLTDSTGTYSFTNLLPDNYTVIQMNLVDYNDISDQDEVDDGDLSDSDTTVDNMIGVTLNPGEEDTGNNFVDVELGDISGTVLDNTGGALSGVTIALRDDEGNTVVTTLTDSTGSYSFAGLEPNNYTVVQTNLVSYADISDQDEQADGDLSDLDTTVDNMINATLIAGESDAGNNFVDILTPPSSSPSSSPSNTPSLTPSSSPSDSPSSTPSEAPSKQPSSSPSESPSAMPSTEPSSSPSNSPSSPFPSTFPSVSPSLMPSSFPSSTPTKLPSSSPSDFPSLSPSESPTRLPSVSPTDIPTRLPSFQPSASPNACDDFPGGKTSANAGTRSRKLQFGFGPNNSGNDGDGETSGNNNGFGGGFGNGGLGNGGFGSGGFGSGGFGSDGFGSGGFGSGGDNGFGSGSFGGNGFGQGNSNGSSDAGGTSGGGGGGSSSVGSSGEGSGSTLGAGKGSGLSAGCSETNNSGNGVGGGAGNSSGGGGFGGGISNNPFAGNGQSNGESLGAGGGQGASGANTSGNAGGEASGGGNGFGNGTGLGIGNSGGFGFGNGFGGLSPQQP